jgi:hypothetical protein
MTFEVARGAGVSESAYQLRLARSDDAPSLEALIDASVRALGQGFYTPAEIDASLRHVFGVDTQLPGVPLYAALAFEAIEPVAVPTPAGVALPCVRMRRAIAAP